MLPLPEAGLTRATCQMLSRRHSLKSVRSSIKLTFVPTTVFLVEFHPELDPKYPVSNN